MEKFQSKAGSVSRIIFKNQKDPFLFLMHFHIKADFIAAACHILSDFLRNMLALHNFLFGIFAGIPQEGKK